MKVKSLLTLAILCPLFTSCDLFEEKGDIKDYMGTYVIEGCQERTYHIAWNNKTLISEKDIPPGSGCTVVINEDATVLFTDKEGKTYNGTVKCLEKYCRFFRTPLESSYHFERYKYDHDLHYSYESKHASVEYDVTYRTIHLVKQS